MIDDSFRPHPEFPHLLVSTDGRVFSTKSHGFVGRLSGSNSSVGRPDRTVTPNPYMRVTVQNKPFQARYTQALVLETFVGPRPDGHDADHINHIRLDNRLENLRWRPSRENQADNRPAA